MATPDQSVLVEQLMGLGAFVGAGVAAIWAGRKAKPETTSAQATVLAGAITDSKQVANIIEALDAVKLEMRDGREQRHRDANSMLETILAVERALKDNTAAMRSMGAADMLALFGKMK
jgi:hypothetical protein